MPEALEKILRLVAEGRLTAEEAAPIVEALSREESGRPRGGGPSRATGSAAPGGGGAGAAAESAGSRRLRISVHDDGRQVVEVVVPGALASLAGSIPGIPAEYVSRVRAALAEGLRGPIVDVRDEHGDGVTITLE